MKKDGNALDFINDTTALSMAARETIDAISAKGYEIIEQLAIPEAAYGIVKAKHSAQSLMAMMANVLRR